MEDGEKAIRALDMLAGRLVSVWMGLPVGKVSMHFSTAGVLAPIDAEDVTGGLSLRPQLRVARARLYALGDHGSLVIEPAEVRDLEVIDDPAGLELLFTYGGVVVRVKEGQRQGVVELDPTDES